MRAPAQELPQQQHDRILRRPEVCDRLGVSGATLWRMVDRGQFPQPVPVSLRTVGWIEREVSDWLAERAALRTKTDAAA